LLVSGSTIKTINGQSLLGEGDIEIEGGGGAEVDLSEYATKEALYNVQYPLTVKLTATPSLAEYTGNAQQVTITVVAKKGNTTVVPDLITLKQGNNEPIEINGVHQMSVNKQGITTFEITCKYRLEEVTENVETNFVLPTYIGFNMSELPQNLDLSTLSRRIKSDVHFEEAI
jgi:hypothetical protein